MDNRTETIQNGGGLPILLFVTFLVLKLTDTIDWSWWWVTAPLWIPAVFALLFGLVFFLIFRTAGD